MAVTSSQGTCVLERTVVIAEAAITSSLTVNGSQCDKILEICSNGPIQTQVRSLCVGLVKKHTLLG